jgi:hypothetical protein
MSPSTGSSERLNVNFDSTRRKKLGWRQRYRRRVMCNDLRHVNNALKSRRDHAPSGYHHQESDDQGGDARVAWSHWP